jgi:hypothetical protein
MAVVTIATQIGSALAGLQWLNETCMCAYSAAAQASEQMRMRPLEPSGKTKAALSPALKEAEKNKRATHI